MKADELRMLRRKVGDIEISTHDGYRVRQQALVILLNAEDAARREARS